MTKNNQKTYERPTLQVLFVETESVMAVSGGYGDANHAGDTVVEDPDTSTTFKHCTHEKNC